MKKAHLRILKFNDYKSILIFKKTFTNYQKGRIASKKKTSLNTNRFRNDYNHIADIFSDAIIRQVTL